MSFRASLLALALAAAPVAAQQAPTATPETTAIARGWSTLAKGDAAGAANIAAQELSRNPHSTPALILAVEADLTRGGAAGGLTTYERWLGSRKVEEAYVLRRIARAVLAEATVKQPNARARLDALAALAADGDQAAAAASNSGASERLRRSAGAGGDSGMSGR